MLSNVQKGSSMYDDEGVRESPLSRGKFRPAWIGRLKKERLKGLARGSMMAFSSGGK